MNVCISDADILIKLAKTGHLNILETAFDKVHIGTVVEMEAKRKIGTHGKGISLVQGIQEGWIEVIDIKQLEPMQRINIKTFIQSLDPFLDPGELEAAALANELMIPIILSDDRTAKKRIEEFTDAKGLAHWEILTLLINRGILTVEEAEQIFTDINSTRTWPITIPFGELVEKARVRIEKLGFESIYID